MGIIQNKASKSTVYIYIGAVIGFFNSGILFPQYLDADSKGILDLITSSSLIMAVIFSFGLPNATVRMFPYIRNYEQKHYGYLGFLILSCFIGFLLGLIAILIKSEWKIGDIDYSFFIVLLSISLLFRLLYNMVDAYNRVLYSPVLGVVSSNVVLKLISLCSILLFSFSIIDFKGVLIFHVVALSTPGIIALVYALFFQDSIVNPVKFTSHLTDSNIKKDFTVTSLYSLMASFGAIVLLEFDKIMLYEMMDVREVGIYSTAVFFGILINLPTRALSSIASVVIADSWKKNDIENIKDVYTKSTLNLQIIAGYLFIGIVLLSKYVFSIMKPEYSEGLTVLVLIAIAQFVDAVTSVNTDVLSSSKHYKFQTYFMFAMVFILIGLNLWLIPIYGLEGAAISTMIAIVFTNIVRTIFIQIKFGLTPFTKKNSYMFGIMALVFLIVFFIDNAYENSPFYHILLSGLLLTIVYWFPVIIFKISPDLNKMFVNVVSKFKR